MECRNRDGAPSAASPLTIVLAGVAIAFLANTLSEFAKVTPSTGGFITFVGKTFGPTSAVTTALLAGMGYIIAMASVIAISGGFLEITINHYLHTSISDGGSSRCSSRPGP